jgi:hypothetical protein
MKQILLIFLLFSNLSIACSCSDVPPMEKALDQADVVVTGKVLSRESLSKKDGPLSDYLSSQVKYKILITTIHKGKVKKGILTILTGPSAGGDCGYLFIIGNTYTIYAYYHPNIVKEKEINKFITTSVCTRTDKYKKNTVAKIDKYCKSKGYS